MRREYTCINCKVNMPSSRGLRQHYSHRSDCRTRMRNMQQTFLKQRRLIISPNPHNNLEDEDTQMRDSEPTMDHMEQEYRGVSVEEVEDEGEGGQDMKGPIVEEYSDAGTALGEGEVPRQTERRAQQAAGQNPWEPFSSLEEWRFAEWMMKKGISQQSMNELINLQFVSLI